jgi:hypothetical protein
MELAQDRVVLAGFGIWYMLNFLFPVGLPQSYYRNGTIRIVPHSAFWCLSVVRVVFQQQAMFYQQRMNINISKIRYM